MKLKDSAFPNDFFCKDCNNFIECSYHPFPSTKYAPCGQKKAASGKVVVQGKRHCETCVVESNN